MATFDELVKQIDDNLENQRDRGTAFEKMVVAYLKNEPTYKQTYADVWMLNEVPEEYGIPKRDLGVDIVARDYAGNLTAIQAKYYKGKVGKDTINSFVAEMGKDYYSAGMLVSSTDDWNRNAEAALENNTKPITRIGLSQLRRAHFDWQKFSFAKENDLKIKKEKELRYYQEDAINNSLKYFKEHDRGKLIMAPGTGKTFTSLKITEALMEDQGKKTFNVLYLVPSIQLLSQTLFNWNNDVSEDIHMTSFSVVSDRKANQKKSKNDDDLGAKDIGFEPTTNVTELMNNYNQIKSLKLGKNMNVVFSTYQSIDVLHKAQEEGYPEFDLIIADEAHRTTGATKLGEDSAFTEVHSNKNIKSKLRLYQTATPKIYDQNAKRKAEENSIVVSSMDDTDKYGEEIYRLGFGEAVSRGFLTDYKVTVLAVSESYINKDMQQIMAADNQLKVDDIGKIIGVWNAMVKRNGVTGEITGAPMKRAIAFTDTIKHSEAISKEFEEVVNEYLAAQSIDSFKVDVKHVDGGLNALEKEEAIDWLADDNIEDNRARVLSNVRFLTEGIDVPNLDGIIFFSPKESQVDIVQAVGRIMRRAEGKEYGYIILPIVVANGVDPRDALDNDKQYKQVWQVLNALRSTDERFDAEVNKLDLNKKKDGRINFIGVDSSPDTDVTENDGKEIEKNQKPKQLELPLDWREMQNAFYGRVVQKVGDRRYLEDWSKDVSDIAKMYIRRINDLIESNDGARLAFDKFLTSLHHNINDSIDKDAAIQMLAQHLITEPIFDALFGDYDFVKNNVVSKSLNDVITTFKVFGFEKEQEQLKSFYESVKMRASGIDNAAGKQKLIVTLYDKFFSTGFKDTTEQLGIVFTPVEVVDFIIHSVDDVIQKYFGKHLADKGIHILDPFTGTGTFITRTLQYLKQQMDAGQITFDDILRKYLHELHANEIVLLSYYIAAVNIETVFDEVNGPDRGYKPFDGIVLTDTFESTERQDSFMDELLGQNNERLKKQQEQPITAIISNPPYSIVNHNSNRLDSNMHYPKLEQEIANTYVKDSTTKNSISMYDSYIKAFRWATDRIQKKGIVGFITNSGYLDSKSADGFRANLYKDFNHIYIYNLRGAIHGKTGQLAKDEGQNIFDIMTGVSIIILVKDGTLEHQIHYADIGKGLSRKEKLRLIKKNNSIFNLPTHILKPDKFNDWLNQRNTEYESFIPLADDHSSHAIFGSHTMGVKTNRDAWVIGFGKNEVKNKTHKLIQHYNNELQSLAKDKDYKVNNDPKYIKWTSKLLKAARANNIIKYTDKKLIKTLYRPFTKKWMYYDELLVERSRSYAEEWGLSNLMLFTTGRGISRNFSSIVTNQIPNAELMYAGQGFMKDIHHEDSDELIKKPTSNMRKISETLSEPSKIFAYIYALLNEKDYQEKYANNLRKDIAKIPIVKGIDKFVKIGKELISLHLNYEEVEPYKQVTIRLNGVPNYRVNKMKYGKKKDPKTGKSVKDRSTIIFNSYITISDIPEKAYQYIVNGKSAIEWIMDQYKVKTDNKSGIIDDPNDYSDDPKYIFTLLLRIINVSVQTVDLIDQLPKFEVDKSYYKDKK